VTILIVGERSAPGWRKRFGPACKGRGLGMQRRDNFTRVAMRQEWLPNSGIRTESIANLKVAPSNKMEYAAPSSFGRSPWPPLRPGYKPCATLLLASASDWVARQHGNGKATEEDKTFYRTWLRRIEGWSAGQRHIELQL
jgi:hypothetical protein